MLRSRQRVLHGGLADNNDDEAKMNLKQSFAGPDGFRNKQQQATNRRLRHLMAIGMSLTLLARQVVLTLLDDLNPQGNVTVNQG